MVSLVILGCVIMSLFFMTTTTVLKGMSALLDTMFDMLGVFAILILGGVVIAVIEIIVMIFGGGFWNAFWWIVGILVVGYFVGSFIALIGSLFLLAFELALYVATFIYGILDLILEKLGEWSELGLKYFLGIINQKIVLS